MREENVQGLLSLSLAQVQAINLWLSVVMHIFFEKMVSTLAPISLFLLFTKCYWWLITLICVHLLVDTCFIFYKPSHMDLSHSTFITALEVSNTGYFYFTDSRICILVSLLAGDKGWIIQLGV
jgi:hypothetical protein